MLPLYDDQPRRSTAYVTYSIIAVNLAVFAYQFRLAMQDPRAWDAFLTLHAEVPHHFQLAFQGSPQYSIAGAFLTILTSMFMHGGWLHVLGNMWFLRIFGDNIEDHLGHATYAVFYLFCGFVASMAQLFVDPTSDIPMLGASGAIAGIMGAFLLRYPQARIRVYWFYSLIWMSAYAMLFYWFALQFLGQLLAQNVASRMHTHVGGVAYMAHLAGFVTGLVLIKLIPGRADYAYGAWTKNAPPPPEANPSAQIPPTV
jgi:membrane associated rhomboid family serine protease